VSDLPKISIDLTGFDIGAGKNMGRSRRQLLGRHALDLAMSVRKNDHSFKCDFGTQSTVRIVRSERRGQCDLIC
jgi:hypothetical protein